MKVDYTLVTPFFIETVNSASATQLKQLSEDLGISESDKTGIIKWFYTYNGVKGFADKVLTFMAEHPLFDMSRLSQMEHYYCTLDAPVPVTVPTKDTGYRVGQLLEKGIFRITVKESDDIERTYVVTNNRLELRRVFGEDYYRYYESKNMRVTWALNMIARELSPDYANDIILPDMYHKDIPITQETYDKLKSCGLVLSKAGMSSVRTYKELCRYLMLLRVKTILETPNKSDKDYAVILARNCQAWYNPSDKEVYSYYIELDTSKIVRIDRLSKAPMEVNHNYMDDGLWESTYTCLKDWIFMNTEGNKSDSSTDETSTDRSSADRSNTDTSSEERVQKEKPSIIDIGYELLSFLRADFTNAESVEPPSSDLKLKNLLSDGLYQVWNSTGVHYVSSDVSCLNKLVGFAETRVLNLMMQEKKDLEAWVEVGKTLNSKFKGQEDIVRHRFEPASMYVSENIMPSYVAGKLRGMCVGELYYLEISEYIRLRLDIGGADEKPTGVNTYEIYLELDSLDTNEYSLNIRFLRLQPLEIKSIKRLY